MFLLKIAIPKVDLCSTKRKKHVAKISLPKNYLFIYFKICTYRIYTGVRKKDIAFPTMFNHLIFLVVQKFQPL